MRTPGHLRICDLPLLSPGWGGGQLVQSRADKGWAVKRARPSKKV